MKKNTSKSKQTKKSNEKINLNNEIIIGLTPKQGKNKGKKEKNKKNNNKKNKTNKKSKKITSKKVTQKKEVNKTNVNMIKWTSLCIAVIAIIVVLLKSSLFNIKVITVENNSKITSQEIINISTLKIGTNMFDYSNKLINKKLKTNPYIESAKMKRKIDGSVILYITERKPTYMLKFANAYVYINNQGYMLEITENPLEIPIITGFETSTEEIKEGNRLCVNDLKKLENVIKIMNSANETVLSKLITSIDIQEKDNFKLCIESENKIINFGETTNINVKLLKIQEVLEKEKGTSGEIYFQDDERTVFKETV